MVVNDIILFADFVDNQYNVNTDPQYSNPFTFEGVEPKFNQALEKVYLNTPGSQEEIKRFKEEWGDEHNPDYFDSPDFFKAPYAELSFNDPMGKEYDAFYKEFAGPIGVDETYVLDQKAKKSDMTKFLMQEHGLVSSKELDKKFIGMKYQTVDFN